MPRSFRRLLLSIFAAILGLALGYLHVFSIISIPVEPGVQWMLPYVKEIDNHLYNYGAHFVLVAAMLFVLAIPNTVVVALLVAVAMKAIRRPRTVFYATFFWPVFGYLAYWLDVLRLATRAEQLGLPSDIGHLPVDVLFPTRAVCYLLTYSLYTLLVLVIYRYISATRHNTPLNTDAPPNGDAPVS